MYVNITYYYVYYNTYLMYTVCFKNITLIYN